MYEKKQTMKLLTDAKKTFNKNSVFIPTQIRYLMKTKSLKSIGICKKWEHERIRERYE